MPSRFSLDISGYRDLPVPNTFTRQDQETQHLGVILPGYGYRATMPVLYYPERLLVTRGADVLRVEYGYDQQPGFPTLSDTERSRWFHADVAASCDAALAQRAYQRITLVGKSIGTRAMGHLLETDDRFRGAQCVWLTPLLRDARLCDQVIRWRPRSLFVIGTADSQYDSDLLGDLELATQGQGLVVEGANHSLEIEGDVVESLHALEQMVQAVDVFLG
jgi:hypothetical protein